MARGSLAEEIWQEAQDKDVHPEIALNARVRIGRELCPEELTFVRRRKGYTTQALAKYLEISEADVVPEDVPTIAVCGSGGGLRALVAGAASFLSVKLTPSLPQACKIDYMAGAGSRPFRLRDLYVRISWSISPLSILNSDLRHALGLLDFAIVTRLVIIP